MLLRSRSYVARNREEPPRKKKKKKKASLILPHTTISSLPDDLVLICLARVSRSYYPTLSLVSKKFRSLIASPELYEVRSLLGLTECCLYVCLRSSHDPHHLRWFTLFRRPDTTKKQSKSSGNLLVPIPSPRFPQSKWPGVVAAGSSIYWIGGLIDNKTTSSVSVLDCRSHTWRKAPNMQVPRRYLAASVIDGKIYVIGGRVDRNSSSWIEVFDTRTGIWNSVSSPGSEIIGREIVESRVIDGKVCMFGGGRCVDYNPKDGTCEPLEWDLCKGYDNQSHCVIDNVLFYYDEGVFKWFDTKARLWKNMKGLEGIMRKICKRCSLKLADYGGKIVVLWDKDEFSSGCDENKVIWCSVIAIERRDSDEEEIWGTVEWFDVVLTLPRTVRTVLSYKFMHVLATTL